MSLFSFPVINPGKKKKRKKKIKREKRKKRNTNQTDRDAALHGWIRVTVGLSPWEHCSAINKKINKPFYLFIFPSLPSSFDFSSASGNAASIRKLCRGSVCKGRVCKGLL